jgi:hypothetical protein
MTASHVDAGERIRRFGTGAGRGRIGSVMVARVGARATLLGLCVTRFEPGLIA